MSTKSRSYREEQPTLWERLEKVLPKWARYDEDEDIIIIQADTVFPKILEALEVEEVDKYWKAVCRRCATTFLRKKVGHPIHVRIVGSKEKWGRGLPEGMGGDNGSDKFMTYYNKATKDL